MRDKPDEDFSYRPEWIKSNNVGIDVLGKLINNAGNWISPPPPTTASIKPAINEKMAKERRLKYP